MKNKYLILNGSVGEKRRGELIEIAYASSLKKAKKIAKSLIDKDLYFVKNHEFTGLFKNKKHIFATAIKLNSDDAKEYIFYKEVTKWN